MAAGWLGFKRMDGAALADLATKGTHLVLSSNDDGNLLCAFGHPDVSSARAKLLSQISRRERRRDLEQGQRRENRKENGTGRGKSGQNGYSDGNGIDVRLLIQILVFLTYGNTWSMQTGF
jgi:hypothetical protein